VYLDSLSCQHLALMVKPVSGYLSFFYQDAVKK